MVKRTSERWKVQSNTYQISSPLSDDESKSPWSGRWKFFCEIWQFLNTISCSNTLTFVRVWQKVLLALKYSSTKNRICHQKEAGGRILSVNSFLLIYSVWKSSLCAPHLVAHCGALHGAKGVDHFACENDWHGFVRQDGLELAWIWICEHCSDVPAGQPWPCLVSQMLRMAITSDMKNWGSHLTLTSLLLWP